MKYPVFNNSVTCKIITMFHYKDLDECAENESLCDQICNNTFGSYVCSCEPGYTLQDNLCEGKNDVTGEREIEDWS